MPILDHIAEKIIREQELIIGRSRVQAFDMRDTIG